jgi:hypothetical protein
LPAGSRKAAFAGCTTYFLCVGPPDFARGTLDAVLSVIAELPEKIACIRHFRRRMIDRLYLDGPLVSNISDVQSIVWQISCEAHFGAAAAR